tara:strand:+ start:829 stop:1293 length:465 start_codon:yes stop_codon:yes gene_type:complete
MAEEKGKGEEKGGGEKGSPKSGKKNYSNSRRSAASRGVGGGLLLGFSTCAVGGAVGKTLIHPMHRLRGIEHLTGEIKFFFDSCKGGLFTGVDTVTLTIADEYYPGVWRTITNMIAGSWSGDTMVWVHNACAVGHLKEAPTIPGVTAIDIAFAAA